MRKAIHSFNLSTVAATTASLSSENVCSSLERHGYATTMMTTPSKWFPKTVYILFLLCVLLGLIEALLPVAFTVNPHLMSSLIGSAKFKYNDV